jgi:hypothetical protein
MIVCDRHIVYVTILIQLFIRQLVISLYKYNCKNNCYRSFWELLRDYFSRFHLILVQQRNIEIRYMYILVSPILSTKNRRYKI